MRQISKAKQQPHMMKIHVLGLHMGPSEQCMETIWTYMGPHNSVVIFSLYLQHMTQLWETELSRAFETNKAKSDLNQVTCLSHTVVQKCLHRCSSP